MIRKVTGQRCASRCISYSSFKRPVISTGRLNLIRLIKIPNSISVDHWMQTHLTSRDSSDSKVTDYRLDNQGSPSDMGRDSTFGQYYIINSLVAQPKGSTSLIPKPAIGHDPKAVHPPHIRRSCLHKNHLNVIILSDQNSAQLNVLNFSVLTILGDMGSVQPLNHPLPVLNRANCETENSTPSSAEL
jgi:hypothetical protein